jgi:hypothetical protein
MERATQIARRNNYPFLQPKHLELLVEVNMASCAKHGWSALQSAFTAPKFSATAGDALIVLESRSPFSVRANLSWYAGRLSLNKYYNVLIGSTYLPPVAANPMLCPLAGPSPAPPAWARYWAGPLTRRQPGFFFVGFFFWLFRFTVFFHGFSFPFLFFRSFSFLNFLNIFKIRIFYFFEHLLLLNIFMFEQFLLLNIFMFEYFFF